MKIIGVVPARMAASRFPGKPLALIHGMPMIEHVFLRAQMYSAWSTLCLATCDQEIKEFGEGRGFPVVMTGRHHTRALDRVAEAVTKLDIGVADDDIIVCVQGDEPMMRPDMIDRVIAPLLENSSIAGTILAMHITEESIWLNPDTVKLIFNEEGEVLYTSRAPVPYCKGLFSPELMAYRIYGIFAFRWKYLNEFTRHPETRLEKLESCDSNRILDMDFRQYIAPYPYMKSYSVDSPPDIDLVERNMLEDQCWLSYRSDLNKI
jgi:3-deoxy-manno-octulosonate cytidylyltransferase (CMP-KDO synthetase)